MVNINGQMVVYMKAHGKIINCMVKDFTHGVTAGDMKDFMLKIKNKVMVHTNGLMAASTKGTGTMANNMEKAGLSVAKAK